MTLRAPSLLVLALLTASLDAQQPLSAPPSEDLSIAELLQTVENALTNSDRAAWLALMSSNADAAAAAVFFDENLPPSVTRFVIRERDRQPLLGALPGDGYSLVAEVFIETGARGRINTWRLDIRRPRDSTERQPWRITDQEKLSSVEGLHRLALNSSKQLIAQNLVIRSVDFELRLPTGDVFYAETAEGMTALVLLGDGAMVFAPTPSEERGQVRLFANTDTLETTFSAAFVRINPFDFDAIRQQQALTAASTVDPRTLRRAQEVFSSEVDKSFSLDLNDLSRETWSLLPQLGDFVAEVRTRRFDTLTFARSTNEAEDVTLFHRERKRNISAYASEMKLSSRGRFYDEDDLVEYDVLDYDVAATFLPEREWLEGRTRMRLRVKAYALAALTLKLGEGFNVKTINSAELGRLLFLRVRNQNSIVVNLPEPVTRDYILTLTIDYSGRARSQGIDSESLDMQGQQRGEDMPYLPPEPNWLFSNRVQWYPQAQVSDYATATIRFTVPAEYTVVASGLAQASPLFTPSTTPGQSGRATFLFTALQPLRYLSVVVSKFNRADDATVALDIVPPAAEAKPTSNLRVTMPPIGSRNTVALAVEANRRQLGRGRDILDTAAEILRFFSTIVGDVPYDGMTIAMVENDRPGGHSPGYMAVINNPLPVTTFQFRNDPAMFMNFPEFYTAHEMAHQWWGQAVGWKNYHEQWLSEGFAQYFAAMYAKERRGEDSFRDVLRQLRRWAMDRSDQGAVYLGYRLGHIKGDSRDFRALVYNKGALVLHMLRRLIGDEAFWRGLRQYYAENRFKKAGTGDLQRAMETASGQSLTRFFTRWIFESGLPRVRYSSTVDGQELIVRFEQVGDVYDLPVTVTLEYADKTVDEIVTLTEAVTEKRIPLAGTLRSVDVNRDYAALGDFEKR